MESDTIAQVAAATKNLYEICYQSVKQVHKYPRNWSGHFSNKIHYYEAMTDMHYAQVCAGKLNIGEQIARLKRAHKLLKDLNSVERQIVETVEGQIKQAKKENLVLKCEVPDYKTLHEVEGAASAKPVPFECPLLGHDFPDPFRSLMTGPQRSKTLLFNRY
ncbi:Rhophilin, Rho GTPase binding protein [Cichlidogyrus casuarinus]|uniref:Rhophilin, Rho GTPase binding protein n=1 Tax=Cichlidogyrus casuarinus TaxID=1844966 RepID=A0ABD2PRM5_9PLAT